MSCRLLLSRGLATRLCLVKGHVRTPSHMLFVKMQFVQLLLFHLTLRLALLALLPLLSLARGLVRLSSCMLCYIITCSSFFSLLFASGSCLTRSCLLSDSWVGVVWLARRCCLTRVVWLARLCCLTRSPVVWHDLHPLRGVYIKRGRKTTSTDTFCPPSWAKRPEAIQLFFLPQPVTQRLHWVQVGWLGEQKNPKVVCSNSSRNWNTKG